MGDAAAVLDALGWCPVGRHVVSVEVAGAGNMNLVERVTLDDGATLILKRAHGWVEKYPDIPAPIGRAGVEAAFYSVVSGSTAGAAMPAHLGYDEGSAANLFADLGAGSDGMAAYTGAAISGADLEAVAEWVRGLHALPVPADPRLTNQGMRALNALHIFDFPLDPANGFNVDSITQGLQEYADRLKQDAGFIAAVQAVKSLYLADLPGVLLHGDLYPGSWLTTRQGLFVIDPEFCWIGPREWDIGVLIAHLKLSNQPAESTTRLISRYSHPIDMALARRIAGIEIMRRLIGVAQLPLANDLAAKKALLDEAYSLVMDQ
ncbi:MAG: phosphotransferase [Pseudomonadota bacterium]